MRLLLVLAIVFALVVALGFWTNNALEASSEDLLRHVEDVALDVEGDNWRGAYGKTVELEKTWGKKSKWWPIILDHQEIDNIEFAQARVKEYVATKNNALARGQLSELELMIRHIPETEKVTLKNIL
ncbi:MAG: DUF4363 family protein [Eubacteriales bacterium]